jgi:hypothetical protein
MAGKKYTVNIGSLTITGTAKDPHELARVYNGSC